MKSRDQIRAETQGKIPRPADYQYGAKLKEWEPAETRLSRDEFIRQVQPLNDRIVVRLMKEPQAGKITLTDPSPLIGGCRKAIVLKTGPGRWIPGKWRRLKIGHTVTVIRANEEPGEPAGGMQFGNWASVYRRKWFPERRRPVAVQPGQIVLIGNWVDLEVEDIALCQEGDIRVAWPN